MTEKYKAFIGKLATEMHRQGLKPIDVARKMNVGQSTVYNWISLRTIMSGCDLLRAGELFMGWEL